MYVYMYVGACVIVCIYVRMYFSEVGLRGQLVLLILGLKQSLLLSWTYYTWSRLVRCVNILIFT